jgi:ABC-2 type transport system ATP-binding protein
LSGAPFAREGIVVKKEVDQSDTAVEVRQLLKRFGEFRAVDGLDLAIRRGEFLSLLGPNGAGKSTTVRILSTLLPASEGSVVIGGYRVPQENDRIKPLLGLVPQEIALYEVFSARQNLRFFARLYGLRGATLEGRVRELLDSVGLADRADDPLFALSGGMKRRVNIAAALVHDPEILFLDEPTVGLDPVSRSAIWTMLENLKARGKTLVLTTHYMEEAEALSDRVAIIDHGKLIALGTAAELIQATGVLTEVDVQAAGDIAACLGAVQALPGVSSVLRTGRPGDGRLQVFAEQGNRLLPLLIETLLGRGIEVHSVQVMAPNLGAVFLHYTGRELRDG